MKRKDFTRREVDCQAKVKIVFTIILQSGHLPVTWTTYNKVKKLKSKGDDLMLKMTAFLKKFAVGTLILAIVLAVFPFAGASAAGLTGQYQIQPDNPRLENLWARQQAAYQRQSDLLSNASTFISRVQALIDKASAKGWDTSGIQAALNALSTVIPAVQAAHDPGAAIIASHAGFDAGGKVTDRSTAITTVKSLAQVLKDTRTAMNGTLKALHEAVKAFRQTHPHPAITPAIAPSTPPAS
jgi:hypothetical protein